MKPPVHRGLPFAAALAVAALIAACGDRTDESTSGSKSDTAASRTADTDRGAGDTAIARSRLGQAGQAGRDGSGGPTGVMGAAADAREKAYGPAAGEPKVDDTRLTSMVLTGLKADRELNPLRIDVDTRDGIVTLSGSVPSAAVKARAAEIAMNVKDVKSVNNQLTLATS